MVMTQSNNQRIEIPKLKKVAANQQAICEWTGKPKFYSNSSEPIFIPNWNTGRLGYQDKEFACDKNDDGLVLVNYLNDCLEFFNGDIANEVGATPEMGGLFVDDFHEHMSKGSLLVADFIFPEELNNFAKTLLEAHRKLDSYHAYNFKGSPSWTYDDRRGICLRSTGSYEMHKTISLDELAALARWSQITQRATQVKSEHRESLDGRKMAVSTKYFSELAKDGEMTVLFRELLTMSDEKLRTILNDGNNEAGSSRLGILQKLKSTSIKALTEKSTTE